MMYRMLKFVCLLVFLALPLSAQYYESNRFAMQLNPISGRTSQGWSLYINANQRILYLDGREEKLWQEQALSNGERSSQLFIKKQLSEERIYNSQSQLKSVNYYKDEALTAQERYFYYQGFLQEISYRDAAGKELQRKRYQRRDNGSLVSSRLEKIVDGDVVSSVSSTVNTSLAKFSQRRDNIQIEIYDDAKRLVEKREYKAGQLFRERTYQYSLGLLEEEKISYPQENKQELIKYNTRNLVRQKLSLLDGSVVEELNYFYLEDGRVSREESIGFIAEIKIYNYTEEQEIPNRIDFYRRGNLYKTRYDILEEPASFSEKFYVQGVPVLVHVYRNNALVSEETLDTSNPTATRQVIRGL